ncbi:MAG: UbiA family prenyltransferase [Halodesulfurarchaeum sp.]|nr:UbiA family prenyltransferase [Halodesulfurarchaeum sp.]
MSSKTTTQSIEPGLLSGELGEFFAVLLRYGHRLKQVANYTQLDLIAMGVAGVVTVMLLLGLPPSPAPLVIAFVTFAVYVGDRISDTKREPEATSARSQFMNRYKTPLSIASAGAYGLAITVSVFGGPLALAITLVPGLSWVLYASDFLNGTGLPISRLKRVLVLNSAIVGVAWATAIVFLPIAFANAEIGPIAVVLFAYFALDIFLGTEIPNFRDIEDDIANDVRSLPIVFGITRSRHIIYTINVLIVGVLLFAFTTELLSVAFIGAALVGRAYAVTLHGFVGRTDRYRLLEFFGEMKHVLVVIVFAGLLFA